MIPETPLPSYTLHLLSTAALVTANHESHSCCIGNVVGYQVASTVDLCIGKLDTVSYKRQLVRSVVGIYQITLWLFILLLSLYLVNTVVP